MLVVAFRLYDLRQTGYIEREEVSILAYPGYEYVTGLNIFVTRESYCTRITLVQYQFDLTSLTKKSGGGDGFCLSSL